MTSDLPLLPSPSTFVLDSGTTSHFSKPSDIADNVQPAHPGVRVQMPNAAIVRSTHTGTLPLPSLKPLPPEASQTHIIPHLQQSLVSIGVLCDHGCKAIFDQHSAVIMHKEKPILTGHRTNNGLWTVYTNQNKTNAQLNLVTKDSTRLQQHMEDHIRFLHAACFSLVQSTWLQAIHNNNFITWPAITAKNITKHLENPQQRSRDTWTNYKKIFSQPKTVQ